MPSSYSIEEMLFQYQSVLGEEYQGYINHVHRVRELTYQQLSIDFQIEIEIAVAFHDIGVWVYDTMDYLDPSATIALNFVHKEGLEANTSLIEAIISNHHKLGTYQKNKVVEAFRKADLIDLTNGLVLFQIDRSYYRSLVKRFPRYHFTRRVGIRVLKYALRNLRDPFPMMRL